MINNYEVHVIFQIIEHQLQENILSHFLRYSFLWNINNTLSSVERPNFALVFFKATDHGNRGAERNLVGSSSFTLRII